MEFSVRISDRALEDMVLSASESYVLGDGSGKPSKRKKKGKSVETYGYLWGFRRIDRNEGIQYVCIDRFSESLSARRKKGSVKPNEDAIWLKNSIVSRWSPHLSFIGNFHTHPYNSKDQVESCNGWEFSEGDIDFFKNDETLWELTNNSPLMLVMAVAPIERVHETEALWYERNKVWVFNTGQLRFWISIGTGCAKKKKRKFTRDNVYLNLDPRFYNESGARLDGFS